MKKDNQRIKNIKNKIENIVNSFDWETFENDRLTCLAKWQYYESIDLTNNDRFELDKEAYIKTFFNGDYGTNSSYKEDVFIQVLLNQIKEPKHPVFIEYLDYLKARKNEIETSINNYINPPENNKDKIMNSPLEKYKEFNSIFRTIITYLEYRNYLIDEKCIGFIYKLMPGPIISVLDENNLFNSAYNEIENLLLINNNNSDRVIKLIYSDCIYFQNSLEKIHDSNDLNVQNISDAYDNLSFAFLHFYQPIIELIGHEKKIPEIIVPENPHPAIFVNGYAYEIFLEWHNKFKNKDNCKANYSYLIRIMIKDKLIYDIKQGAYLDFLKEYHINLDKVKLLSECETNGKSTIYLDTKSTIYTRFKITS